MVAPTIPFTLPPSPLTAQKSKSHFLSGGAGGLLSAVILQPADLLKTRIQQSPPSSSASATLISTLRTIAMGPSPIRQLWRGTLPSAIRTGAGSAMYFSALNFVRSRVAIASSPSATGSRSSGSSSSLPQLSPLANLTAGAITRAAIGYLMMPATVLKVRYESSLYTYTSLASAARDIFAREGVRGFVAGWGATAVRDAPYAGLYVLFYEQAKTVLARGKGGMDDNAAMVVNALAGAGAAAAATAVTNPFDALKTRIQVNPEKYRNMWAAAKIVWSEGEGRRWKGRALFDGLGLRVARKAVSSALAWGLYERMVR